MAQPDVGAVRRHEGLGLIVLAGAVSACLAFALWSGERSDDPAPVAVASSTVQQPRARPAVPGLADDRQAHNVSAPDKQGRRLLLLLMMSGAGSLGPYGKIGR